MNKKELQPVLKPDGSIHFVSKHDPCLSNKMVVKLKWSEIL